MNYKIKTVLCKKYFKSSGNKIYAEFFEGKYYNKFYIEEDDIGEIQIPYKYKYIYIFSEKGGYRFHLDKNGNQSFFMNFYEYFYDEIDLRKIKIKKLKNNDTNNINNN